MNTTESNNNASKPLVDFDQLQSACDGDAAVMRELIDLYFQQANEILAGLDQAIKGNIVKDVNHLAHKLAGSSLACGISAVVPGLRQMEGNAKAGSMDGAQETFVDVSAQMVNIRKNVEDYLLEYSSKKH